MVEPRYQCIVGYSLKRVDDILFCFYVVFIYLLVLFIYMKHFYFTLRDIGVVAFTIICCSLYNKVLA